MSKLLGGHYQFLQALGSSEVRQTYLAADIHLPGHPKCTIKKLPLEGKNPHILPFTFSLMEQKVKNLQALSQKGQIARILTYFVENNHFYIVQEFIPGHSLNDEIQPGYPLSEYRVLQIVREVLQILCTAHHRGIVHHNLKPSNIIRRHRDGQLALIDFRAFELTQTHSENSSETPFTSPYSDSSEVKGQMSCDRDLYAVGAIAIQALMGCSTREFAQHKPTFWLKTVNARSDFVTVLRKMVHPEEQKRYQDAKTVLTDLQKLLSNRIAARKPPPPPLLPKPQVKKLRLRLSPRRLLAGEMGAVALLLALAYSLRLPQTVVAQYWLSQGRAKVEKGQEQDAIADYTRAIELKPHSDRAYYQRGVAYARQEENKAALADLTQAIQLNSRSAEFYYQRGNSRLAVGDLWGAQGDYTQAIELDATFAKAYINRGSTRAIAGNERDAIADYTQAIDLNPKFAPGYLNRCLSHSNLSEQQKAIQDCTQAINLRPNHPFGYQNRGLVYRRLGNFQRALEDYNIALRLDSNDAEPYYNRGLTRADLDDYRGAIADYTAAIAREPEHLLAYYDRGMAYLKLRDRSAAEQDFRKAAQQCLTRGKIECYNNAAQQLQKLNVKPPEVPTVKNSDLSES
ncbi:tetratricopeptide repeat protein [Lusitaniella coriacea]|uniref:tetratricopeptide repeat protein n=1 Tax=Lusitaniella coriacea TaxID=1983105 RepID=UPI003CF6159D